MASTIRTIRSGATALPEKMLNFFTVAMVGESGVASIEAGDLLVKQKPAPALAVLISQGAAFLKTSDGNMVYPYSLEVEDAELSLTANASGNPRLDSVVIYIDLAATSNADSTNVAKAKIVQGNPAASPSAPSDATIQASIGASDPFLRLADVLIASGDTTIENSNITDQRVQMSFTDSLNQDFEAGDTKMTVNATPRGRWLRLKDATETIGNAGSGATYADAKYKALFDALIAAGATPTAAWAAGGKITLPAAYNRFLVVAGDTYSVLTTGGTDTHTHLTGDHAITEAEMAVHTHIQQSHTHTQAAHAHGVNDPSHRHSATLDPGTDSSVPGNFRSDAGGGYTAYTHYAYTGITIAAATPTINSTTAVNETAGGGAAHNHGPTNSSAHVPKYLALYAYIKY